jgi:hypothetical protein
MFCLPYTPSRQRYDGAISGWETGISMGTGRGATNDLRHDHTLLDLRQQIHARIPPQRLQINNDGAVPPSIQ